MIFIVFNEIYMFSIDYNTFMKKRNYPSSLYSIPKTDMFFSSGLSALKTLIKKPRSFYIQSAPVLRCVFNIYHKVTNLIHSHLKRDLAQSGFYMLNVIERMFRFSAKVSLFNEIKRTSPFWGGCINQRSPEKQSFDGKHDFQKTQVLENLPSKNQSSSLTARNQK